MTGSGAGWERGVGEFGGNDALEHVSDDLVEGRQDPRMLARTHANCAAARTIWRRGARHLPHVCAVNSRVGRPKRTEAAFFML